MSKFDGHEIDLFEGKFSGGTFDIPADYGEDMMYDDIVAFVVVGSLDESAVKKGRGGSTKRVNTFKISFAMPMTVDEGEAVREAMGWDTLYGEQLELMPEDRVEKPVLTMKSAKTVQQHGVPQNSEVEDDGPPAPVVMPTPEVNSIQYEDKTLASFLYGGQ